MRLGVNIDHVATLRQLRGTSYPSLLFTASEAEAAGAGQITVHLREDRRHIQDEDVKSLRGSVKGLFNLEIAARPEMVRMATRIRPDWVCLVPERRQEVTTEGGLDLKKYSKTLLKAIEVLQSADIRVSLFVEPSKSMMRQSAKLGADAVELHTGKYSLLTQARKPILSRVNAEIKRIRECAILARSLGLHIHAGHGLDFKNVRALAALESESRHPLIEEYNIGHSLVCRAVEVGMTRAVREMVSAIQAP